MSNEEFQGRMGFIVEQQAQFASDMQVLRESQAQTDQVVARLAYVTREGFNDVNVKINSLIDAQIKTEEAFAHRSKDLNAKIDALVTSQARLTDAQAKTDESLRSLIEAQGQNRPRLRANGEEPEESDHEH